MPNEKPLAGFWANRLLPVPPNKPAEVVVVAAAAATGTAAGAGAAAAAAAGAAAPPRPPNEKPVVLAAGALKYKKYRAQVSHGGSIFQT